MNWEDVRLSVSDFLAVTGLPYSSLGTFISTEHIRPLPDAKVDSNGKERVLDVMSAVAVMLVRNCHEAGMTVVHCMPQYIASLSLEESEEHLAANRRFILPVAGATTLVEHPQGD